MFRGLVGWSLSDAGYKVITASDGVGALAKYNEHNDKRDLADIDLTVSDIIMPNMDGYELIEAVRNHNDIKISEVPIIVITGAEDTESAKEKVVNLGATDLIGKPFDKTEVISRVNSYINYL